MTRRSVLFVAAMLLASACGLKPGVSRDQLAQSPAPVGEIQVPEGETATTAEPLPSRGASPAKAAVPSSGRQGPSPVARSGTMTARTTAGATSGDRADPAPSEAISSPEATTPRRPDDRTGVSPTEIRIGFHLPITGAAPVPQNFEKYTTLYARWLADRGGIHGRNIRIIVRDDQLNPSRAVQVCRELVEAEKVFLLGGISPNEAAACARYAERMGVPYLSAAGADAGLGRLGTYHALSMSYPQQSPMLVQLVKRLGKSKLGIVAAEPRNLDDTYESIFAAARSAGLTVVYGRRVKEKGDDAESVSVATGLRQAGAEVVYVVGPPVLFLKLAHAAQGQAYNPQWIGPGPTAGFNLVAELGCPSIGAAKFLSPFPQLDVIDRYDPEFRPASRRYNGEEPDDLSLLAWGVTKSIAVMLAATGPDLSRQSFLATLQSGREFASGVYAPVRYGPHSRFGARQSHLLEADCQARRYRTLATFVSEL